MRGYIKSALASVAALTVAMAVQGAAWAEDFNMRLAHFYPDAHIQAGPIRDFVKAVEENSGGRIKVTTYGAETLVTGRESLEATESGVVDASVMAFNFLLGDLPDLEFYTYPYLFDDAHHFRRAVNGGIRDLVSPMFSNRNVKLMNFYHKGAMILIDRDKFLATPEDYKGRRIAILTGATGELFAAMGANPISMALSELEPAMARGIIDSHTTNCAGHFSRGFIEHLKYVTFADLSQGGEGLGINMDFYNRLPEDLQKVVSDAAAQMEDEEWNTVIKQDEEVCMDKWKEAGAPVHVVTDEERNVFREYTKPLIEERVKQRPQMQQYLDIAEQTR